MDYMKAVVLETTGLAGIRIRDVPVPTPGTGEVLGRVLACGVGGTVLRKVRSIPASALPVILGHEAACQIVAVGKGENEIAVDDRAVLYFYITCGNCRYCSTDRPSLCENEGRGELRVGEHIDGALAEYVCLPARNFIKIPPTLNPVDATVVIDAISTPLHVCSRAQAAAGERMAIIGAAGGVGVHLVQVAANLGLSVIAIDRAEKLPPLVDFTRGDLHLVPSDDANLLDQLGGSIDIVVDFVGSADTSRISMNLLGRGGRLVALARDATTSLLVPGIDLVSNELSVLGSKYATPAEVQSAVKMVADGSVRAVITESGGLDDVPSMLEKIESGITVGRAVVDLQA